MHSSTIVSSIGLLFGFLAQSAMATVNAGSDSAGTPIAWIGGQSECTHTVIGSSTGCDSRFTLNNGHTYFLKGCGGNGLTLFNGDGSFNSNCRFVGDQPLACGITQHWTCF